MHKACRFLLLFVLPLMGITNAYAVLQDEIQVYSDDINQPGELGLELHVNTTPNGVTSGYAGEVMNHHGLRVTPEISMGLTKTVDVGFYHPMVRTAEGDYQLTGAKFRIQ
jgi:hypothetical protein